MSVSKDDGAALRRAAALVNSLLWAIPTDSQVQNALHYLMRKIWLATACQASRNFRALYVQENDEYYDVLEKLGFKLVTIVSGKIDGIIKGDIRDHVSKLRLEYHFEGDEKLKQLIERLRKGPCKIELNELDAAKALLKHGIAELYIVPPNLPIDNPLWFGEEAVGQKIINDIEEFRIVTQELRKTVSKLNDPSLVYLLIKDIHTLESALSHEKLDLCPKCGGQLRREPLDVTTFKGESGEILVCERCGYRERVRG